MATQVACFLRTHEFTRGEGFQIIMWTCVTEALTKRVHCHFRQDTLNSTCLAPRFCILSVAHCGCQQKLTDTNSFKSVRTCSAEQEECAICISTHAQPVHTIVHLEHKHFQNRQHAYHLLARCHTGLVFCYSETDIMELLLAGLQGSVCYAEASALSVALPEVCTSFGADVQPKVAEYRRAVCSWS